MPSFLFEIGVEEMPARFVPGLAEELASLLTARLEENMIDSGPMKTYATPRRLAALVPDVAEVCRSEEEEVTGPPVAVAYKDGALTKAGSGFAKSQGVDQAALYTVTTDKGEYLACRKTVGGGAALDVLPSICLDILSKLSFPKKMRWGSRDFAFGRPIYWFTALLGAEIVSFDLEGIVSGRITYGHRVMGPGPFELRDADQWLSVIREQGKVLPDPAERIERIYARGDELAKEMGGSIVWNDRLMGEVANLVEWPEPILGRIEDKFLELPREVLLTSMEKHQKSFGVEGADNNLLPYFLTALNLVPQDLDLVRKGWERVLKARLEDARFFWEADCRTDMKLWLDKLDNVIFIGPLGSMGDKSRRLERLCRKVAGGLPRLSPAEADEFARAGRYAKADLVSEMVQEFDSLQGIMGGIYAERAGMDDTVSRALYEQYLPAGPESPCPDSLSGAVLALADRADTLAGCFGLKMIPTGANDPHGLRRAALGICRIVAAHDLDLDLSDLLAEAQAGYKDVKWKLDPAEALDKLLEFFAGRLRALFTGKGFSTRVVDAAIGAGFTDVRRLGLRIQALEDFSARDDFEQAVLTFKRTANIIRKQGPGSENGAGVELTGAFEPDLLAEDQEKALAAALDASAQRFDELWGRDDYAGLLGILGELRPAVDAFFDHVMVMCEDESLKRNRLNLLQALVDRLGRLADFNLLQV